MALAQPTSLASRNAFGEIVRPPRPPAGIPPAWNDVRRHGLLRRQQSEPEERGPRKQILTLIGADPGIHKSDLCRMTGMSWGSISHHLHVLEKRGAVRLHQTGRKTFAFLPETPADDWAPLTVLRDPRAAAIVDHLREHGRKGSQEMADALGYHPKATRRILHHLEQAAVVIKRGYARPQFELGRMPGSDEALPTPMAAPSGADAETPMLLAGSVSPRPVGFPPWAEAAHAQAVAATA